MKTLIDDGKILVGKGVSKFQGVKAVLMGDASTEALLSKSDLAFMPWQSTDTAKLRTQVKFFRSEERYENQGIFFHTLISVQHIHLPRCNLHVNLVKKGIRQLGQDRSVSNVTHLFNRLAGQVEVLAK